MRAVSILFLSHGTRAARPTLPRLLVNASVYRLRSRKGELFFYQSGSPKGVLYPVCADPYVGSGVSRAYASENRQRRAAKNPRGLREEFKVSSRKSGVLSPRLSLSLTYPSSGTHTSRLSLRFLPATCWAPVCVASDGRLGARSIVIKPAIGCVTQEVDYAEHPFQYRNLRSIA